MALGDSQAPQRSKRPSRVAVSDSEEEEADARAKKRSRVSPSRSSPAEVENSDLDDLMSEDGGAPVASKDKGKGRPVNGHAPAEHQDEANGHAAQPSFRREYERDPKDGHVVGSIVRMKMRGFMTYDHVDFRPGPHLNMILGPNGTGKSSIAAAIAIGLGFPPKVMGRASDLKSYVKQGSESAETEVELKGKRGRNVIIKRRFTREDDKSEWFLNGHSSTKTAVTETVMGMGIQANNLCSFLPQDKVAEFAKMAPVTVLKETMRAAGDPRLTNWHEKLVQKGGKAKEIEDALEQLTNGRDELQAAVDRMEPDVDAYRARADQERERDVLRILVTFAERWEFHIKASDCKRQLHEVTKRLKKINDRDEPLRRLFDHYDNLREKASVKLDDADVRAKELRDSWKRANRRCEDIGRQSKDVSEQLDALKRSVKAREEKKELQRRKIRNAQTILEEPRENHEEETAALNQKKRQISNEVRDVETAILSGKSSLDAKTKELARLTKTLEERSRQMQALSSIEQRKEEEARRYNSSIGFAIDWIRKHPERLRGRVHFPPMISVNIRDKSLASQIEACTSVSQRSTFICELYQDYETLLKLNNLELPNSRGSAGKVQLYLSHVDVTEQNTGVERPCTPQQMTAMGFDGFAIDFIDAEPGVIAFLNEKARMNTAAVSRRPGGQINTTALQQTSISMWATSTNVNRLVRSMYGRKDAQITTSALAPARAFQLRIDQTAIKKLEEELADLKLRIKDEEQPLQKLHKDNRENDEHRQTLQAQQRKIDSRISDIRDKSMKYATAKQELRVAEKILADLEAEASPEAKKQNLQEKKLKSVKELVKPIQDYFVSNDEAVAVCDDIFKHGFVNRQATLDLQAIKSRSDERKTEGEELTREKDRLTEERAEYKAQQVNRGQKIAAQCSEETDAEVIRMIKERLGAVGKKDGEQQSKGDDLGPSEAIQQQMQAIEADLELSAGVDPALIARYERQKTELKHRIDSVQERERDLGVLKTDINDILGKFDPALDSLVELVSGKFSAAFERVGCTGEVRINRVAGDFAAWGIEILVSYRDGDNLSVLTGSMQSGGERSLATVTYLMSLSEMARTPFSLVDEINQGMDQRAERNVHNQLVDVTCGTDAGQYFLITPKLLNGLKYHEKMKVLIINNGSHLPSPTDKNQRYGDLGSCLARYIAAKS